MHKDLPNSLTILGWSAGMIAGGSGLTPMMQVASQILANKDDKTRAGSPLAQTFCICIVLAQNASCCNHA